MAFKEISELRKERQKHNKKADKRGIRKWDKGGKYAKNDANNGASGFESGATSTEDNPSRTWDLFNEWMKTQKSKETQAQKSSGSGGGRGRGGRGRRGHGGRGRGSATSDAAESSHVSVPTEMWKTFLQHMQ